MPSVYQAECPHCNYESGITRAECLVFRMDDGTWEYIPHPGESSDLNARGFTLEQAEKEERLGHVYFMTCEGCGEINEKFVANPYMNCLIPLVLTLVFFVVCLWQKWDCFWCILPAIVFERANHLLQFRPVKRRQMAMPQLLQCKKCDAKKFRPLGEGKSGVCPQCGKKGFRYVPVGFC